MPPLPASHIRIVSARISACLCGHAPIPEGGYAVYYFVESHALLTVDGRTRDMSRRQIALFSSLAEYDIRCQGKLLCEIVFGPCGEQESELNLRGELQRSRQMQRLIRSVRPSLTMSDSENLFLVLLHIFFALRGDSPCRRGALCALVSTLFLKLTLNYCQHNTANGVRLISQVQRYLFEHRCEDLTVQQIAEHTGVSRAYLQTLFARHKRHTLRDYITRLRVDDAALLLLFSRESVERVGYACGFHSRQHFSRVFTSQMGLSPGEYRRLCADGMVFSEMSYGLTAPRA